MGRKLFNLAAAVSLVCCVLAVGMWCWSWREADSLVLPLQGDPALIFSSKEGSLVCFIGFAPIENPPSVVRSDNAYKYSLATVAWLRIAPSSMDDCEYHGRRLLGAGYYYFSPKLPKRPAASASLLVDIPFWIVLVVASTLPTFWVIHRVRFRHKSAFELCTACGYDLRATPDRCPECGKEVAGKAAAEVS